VRGDQYTQARLAWLEAVALADLSALAERCCILLAVRHANREQALQTGELWAWPSQIGLAAATGSSRKGVEKALRTVEAAGLVQITAGRGRHVNSRYRLTMPAITPTPVGGFRPRKPPPPVPLFQPRKGELLSPKTPPPVPGKTPTPVRTNPVKNPLKNPASRRVEAQEEFDKGFARIWAAMPRAPRERSSIAQVKDAVARIVAEGVEIAALAMAVESFCQNSDAAKDKGGRFMGVAHTWLTDKRGGWESHLPTADAVFMDGRPREDWQWLSALRKWQRLGQWDRYEFGPSPDQEGCRAPPAVLAHVLSQRAEQSRGAA
jgi:hypothetical protein